MPKYLWFIQGISRCVICKLIHQIQYEINSVMLKSAGLPFVPSFVRNGYFCSTFSSSSCQYCSAWNRFHSWPESVLVSSFPLRRLKSSFHLCFNIKIRAAKISTFLWLTNWQLPYSYYFKCMKRKWFYFCDLVKIINYNLKKSFWPWGCCWVFEFLSLAMFSHAKKF